MVDTSNLPPSVTEAIENAPPPPEETQTIGQAYTSRSKSRGGSIATQQTIYTKQQEGKLQEEIKARKAAEAQAKAQAQAEAEAQERLKEASKRQEIRIIKGLEREAEQAARIARITSAEEDTPFLKLARRREAELLEKAGKEAKLAHFPQTFIKEKDNIKVVSSQVKGKKKIEQPEKPILYTGEIRPGEPPTLQQKALNFVTSKQGTVTGVMAGSLYAAGRFTVGTIKGGIAFFDPRTYTRLAGKIYSYGQIGGSAELVADVYNVREGLSTLGPEIMRDPGILAETGGYFYGFGKTSKFTTSKLAKKFIAVKKNALITAETVPEKPLSAKETKFISKISERGLTKQQIKALESIEGKGMVQDRRIIDLNKLNDKQLNKLIDLQKQGKIKTNYELESGVVKPEEVGFVYKKGIPESKATIAARQKLSERLTDLFAKEGGKARKITETATAAKQKAITSPELEKFIRAEMKRTGKPAASIYADLQKEGKAPPKVFYKELTPSAQSSKPGIDQFKGMDEKLKNSNPFAKENQINAIMGRSNQKLILIEETGYLRGLTPIEALQFPTAENIATAKNILTAQKTSPLIATTGLKLDVRQIPATKTLTAQGQITTPKTEVSTKLDIRTLQEVKQTPISATSTRTLLQTSQKTEQALKQEQITAQTQTQKLTTIQSQPAQTPPIFNTPFISTPYSKVAKKNLYTAEVRKKGEFIDIGSFDSPFKAFAAAKREVSTTASASLRVRGSGGLTGLPLGLSPSQFRRSTKEEGVFIERREKRIKSYGELSEITFKGIAAQKTRRTNGLFSNKRKKSIFR